MQTHCSVCELEFEEHPGSVWGFWIFTDRIILFGAILALYFGFTPESWYLRSAFLVIVIVPLVATMPHRQGAFVAIDYLSRTHWRS